MGLPVVKRELLYGIEQSIKSDGFLLELLTKIDKENPVVSSMIARYVDRADIEFGEGSRAGNMLLACGICVYHMLSAQADSDELEEQNENGGWPDMGYH